MPQPAALGQADETTHIIAREPAPSTCQGGRWYQLPDDPDGFAKELYDTLHRCDRAGAELIQVQSLPDGPEWDALRDRLTRASTGM